jgi:tellurite resistance protein
MKTLPLFGMVLGLSGLCNVWRSAQALWHLPTWVAHALAVLAMGSAVLSWSLLRRELSASPLGFWRGAIMLLREPLAALLTMTSLLLSLVLRPYASSVASALFAVAALGQIALAIECAASCFRGARTPETITSALLMPTVGGLFILSLCTSTFVSSEVALPVFGAALVSWLVTESVVVMRLMNRELSPESRATLGIHVTPAASGCLACLALQPDPHSAWPRLLLGYAVLQALVVLRLTPWLRVSAFTPSAWAYTFGASALSTSALQLARRAPDGAAVLLALTTFVATNGIIAWIFVRTVAFALRAMQKRAAAATTTPITRRAA